MVAPGQPDLFEGSDPFDTAAIRARVLAAWAASPARFREDANAEEDYALGGYRDRLVVELAQNAGDAAARAGVAGSLRLSFDGTVLRAANVGAPLDAAGVQSLATLRASAKRDGLAVGRFGVGFAAVLAVSDEPAVHSRNGGVRFSRAETAAAVADLPALADELARRDGGVPTLRLPWPDDASPPAGFDTEVVLPIRPEARAAVEAALADVSPELLLGLPALQRIQIGDRMLTAQRSGSDVELRDDSVGTRWRLAESAGVIPAELLADRPTEERARDRWSLLWAVPLKPDGEPIPVTERVLFAPTPSAEPVSLPARLIASIPLDPDRRHVAPGPLADYLIEQAARGYAELVAGLDPAPAVLELVPRPTLAAGAFDHALVAACLNELRQTEFLSTVDSFDTRVTPEAATALEQVRPDVFADILDGLLPAEWATPRWANALNALGVRRLGVPALIELLSTVDRPASWWHQVYDALAEVEADALAGLPVPLADGRTVTGPRGLLLPEEELPALDALGLRVVAADAAHPLLARLGAQPATAAAVLTDDRVAAQVESALDLDDPEPLSEAVLGLVTAAGIGVEELPWLAALPIPGQDGDWYPAGELLLPGGELAALVADDAPFGRPDPDVLERWGSDVLEKVGALRGFAVLREEDVDPSEADLQLDGESEWYDAVLDQVPDSLVPPVLPDVVAVRDLEFVRPDAWPRALALLSRPPLRRVVLAPTAAEYGDDVVDVGSYTRWWLRTHPVLDGRRPDGLRTQAALDLAGLYDIAPVNDDVAELTGVRTGLADVLADIGAIPDLLARLGDPARTVPLAVLQGVYAQIAEAVRDFELDPPAFVRVEPARVVDRDDAVVLDAPYLLPLLTSSPVPAGGAADAVAELLDLPLASGVVDAAGPDSGGVRSGWDAVPGIELAVTRCGAAIPAASVEVHNGLTVAGVAVSWWPAGDVDHVDAKAGAAALGRALAWRLDRWDRRAAVVEALADPERAAWLAAEDGCC